MKPEQIEKWRVTRQKGMWRYVALIGVLSYGLSCFLVVTFIVERNDLSARIIGFSAVAWAIGGVIFGSIMWLMQERQFRKAGGATAGVQ